MKRIFLLIGPPGSGKTSTAKHVSSLLQDFSHYSVGEIFRAEITNKTKMGRKIERFIEEGVTVPIKIAVTIIEAAIKNCGTKNVIIDGFPRDKEQLFIFISKTNKHVEQVFLVEISVPDDIARERVLTRNRGADDKERMFDRRMMYYLEYKQIIINYFNLKNKYFKLNGNTIFENVCEGLYSLFIELKI